jgi:hypothetical protein
MTTEVMIVNSCKFPIPDPVNRLYPHVAQGVEANKT